MTRRVGADARGLLLDGGHRPWLSAECHSWRLDPAHWPRVLDTVAELGFTVVSTYVPWSRHERPDGSFDFSGRSDVARFARLAAERGLLVSARIGPDSGAELEDSGWPRRVLDDPACQARRPDGRPYLLPTSVHHAYMPSYGSRRTLDAVAGWYAAVAAQLAPLQWPDGPVVAVHVDNEMGYHFQHHAFALDYHPDTVAQWHESHPATDPPHGARGEPEELRVAWVRFREEHLRRSVATLARMQRDAGLDRVLQVHNDYPRLTTPLATGLLERAGVVDVAAGDVYATRAGGRYVRDYARHLDTSTRLAFLAEAGAGWLTLPWLLPMAVGAEDLEHTLWRALSGGARAFNVFMAVARDRWYGTPVAADGSRNEPAASIVARLLALVKELDWPSLRRSAQVLLLENRDESRRAAARAVRGDLVPAFRQVLPVDHRLFEGHDPAGRAVAAWERDARAALDAAGVDADHASTACLPDLSGYTVVLLPLAERTDTETAAALEKVAAGGVRIVTGPGPARLPGTVLAGDVGPHLPAPAWTRDDPALDLVALGGGGRDVVVAHNASPEPLVARIGGPGTGTTLRGRWRDEVVTDGVVRLPPYGVQVYEVLP